MNNKIPRSGLAGMEKKALEVFAVLDAVDVASLQSIEEKKEYYDASVDCFFTLLYVRVPQGRKAAPLSLAFAQAEQLLKGKHVAHKD
jgi:hypothetical protein